MRSKIYDFIDIFQDNTLIKLTNLQFKYMLIIDSIEYEVNKVKYNSNMS